MNFNNIENEIITYWKNINLQQQIIQMRINNPKWEFLDGPPFCNGTPHHGHLLVSSIKDCVARYMSQKGYNISYQIGFDCHGLPLEQEAEKKTGKISVNAPIEKLTEFNDECRNIISNCSEVWYETLGRLGRQFDKSQTYNTSDFNYMNSLWWAFNKLFEQKLIYCSKKVMPYSPLCETPLSNFEATSNYQERTDISVYIKFKIVNSDENLLIWTTTPWSLVANQGICINPELNYSLILFENVKYWVCSDNIKTLFNENNMVLKTVIGSELVGLSYESLNFNNKFNNYKVYGDSYVQSSSGTGLVHLAPLFGSDDMRVMKLNGYMDKDLPNIVDNQVKFNIDLIINDINIKDKFVMDTSTDFVIHLKKINIAFKSEKIKHNYPYCWRTDYPLVYLATDAWFLNVQNIIPELIENNKKIVWYPEYVGTERFANWIKDSPDWCLSRNRIWGTPIPIWINEDGLTKCISSVQELEELTNQKFNDIHLDKLNNITFTIDNKLYKRTFGILDCWFESGMAGLSRFGFPECINKSYPVDFIAESIDQTRGWFYTLNVLSTALNHTPAFKKVIVSGLILASDGKKMSKRLCNYTPVNELIEKYGADVLRLYLIGSPAAKAESFCFKDIDLIEITRKLLPYYNAHLFFNDNFIRTESTHKLDKWIKNKFIETAKHIYTHMEKLELSSVPNHIYKFIEIFCNIYIKLSRDRFKKINDEALTTLLFILNNFNKLLAPFIPHLSEYFNKLLNKESIHLKLLNKESIHLELIDIDYIFNYKLDEQIINGFYSVNELLECIRNQRQIINKPIFMPINLLEIYTNSISISEYSDIICNELNIKKLNIYSTTLLKKTYKANRGILGKTYKKDMMKYILLIESGDILWDGCSSDFYTFEYNIDNKENMIGTKFNYINHNGHTEENIIYINTILTDENIKEASLNNLRRLINEERKKLNLKYLDKIEIIFENNEFWLNMNNELLLNFINRLNVDVKFNNTIDNFKIIELYNGSQIKYKLTSHSSK